jgi:hypothetical protein
MVIVIPGRSRCKCYSWMISVTRAHCRELVALESCTYKKLSKLDWARVLRHNRRVAGCDGARKA